MLHEFSFQIGSTEFTLRNTFFLAGKKLLRPTFFFYLSSSFKSVQLKAQYESNVFAVIADIDNSWGWFFRPCWWDRKIQIRNVCWGFILRDWNVYSWRFFFCFAFSSAALKRIKRKHARFLTKSVKRKVCVKVKSNWFFWITLYGSETWMNCNVFCTVHTV